MPLHSLTAGRLVPGIEALRGIQEFHLILASVGILDSELGNGGVIRSGGVAHGFYLDLGDVWRNGFVARRVVRVKFFQRPPGEAGGGSAGGSLPPPPSESPPLGNIHAIR